MADGASDDADGGAVDGAGGGGLTRRGLLTGAGLVAWAVAGTGLAVAATRPGAPAPVWLDPCAGDGCPSKAASTGRPAGAAGRPKAAVSPPTRVRITRIGVDSPLVVLGLERDGRLAAPTDFHRAGWFGGGVAPGDTGPAVIAGHVDSRTGPAVFHRLPELRPGDKIEVQRNDRWLPFRVVSASRHAKDRFPTAAVYGPTPGPELRLVTCDGEFDERTRHYRDNLVVFAIWDQPVDPFAKWTGPGPA